MAMDWDKTNLKTLQAEARHYGIKISTGLSKEEIWNLVQNAKKNDPELQKIKDDIESKSDKELSDIEKKWKEQMKLKWIILTCNDPDMQEQEGVMRTIFLSSEEYRDAGLEMSVGKYIPYDTVWAVPTCLLDSLKEEYYNRKVKYQNKKENGTMENGYRYVPTRRYNIEEMENPTQEEINLIKTRQQAEKTLSGD
jgi:hypothetical protein